MLITLNGESFTLPDGATVADLVAQRGLSATVCAGEVNRAVVPRRERAERPLDEGDTVEIVTLVGGG